MGAFGAFLHAPLADTVVAFASQTDLSISHLRPGVSAPQDLADLSAKMGKSVYEALAKGTRFEYHVAMENHLVYAKRLLLPPGTIIVHPITGRITRLLSKVGIMAHLLTNHIAELQHNCVRPWVRSQKFLSEAVSSKTTEENGHRNHGGHDRNLNQEAAWDWSDISNEFLSIATWNAFGGMSLVHATPWELSLVARDPPKPGDWYCRRCNGRSHEYATVCRFCMAGSRPPNGVGWLRPIENRCHYTCYGCSIVYETYTPICRGCGGAFILRCSFCGRKDTEGSTDIISKRWSCSQCWVAFANLNDYMCHIMPTLWYVNGGQIWTWVVDGLLCGEIEFGKHYSMRTHVGEGKWWPDGADMVVAFGNPTIRWRLTRTNVGFTALPIHENCGKRQKFACVAGAPRYGTPRLLEVTQE